MPGLRAAIDALRSTPLRRALVVFLVFGVGREAIWLALLLYAYDAGGAGAVAAIAVAQLLPATLLAPLTATWLDRLTAQRGLVLAYGCSAAGALAIGVALLADAPVWLVVTVAVAQSVAVTLVRPAHFAALPRIADLPSRLVAANAASGSVDALGVLLGPVAVAVALGLGQTPAVVVGLALLLALGAVVLAVTSAGAPGDAGGDRPSATQSMGSPEPFLAAATRGVREIRRIPGAFSLLVVLGLTWVVQGALDVLGVTLAIEVLGAGEQGAAAIATGNGTGLLIGSIAAVGLVGVARLSRVVAGGALVGGLALAAAGAGQTLAVVVVLVGLSAVARLFVDVAGRTLLHRNASGHVMARVFGVQEAVLTAGMAVGALLAPAMIAAVGPRGAFALTGALLAAPVAATIRLLRGLDVSGVLAAERVALLRSLDLFALLSAPQLERLALASANEECASDEWVIRQGEVGDMFYAVRSGRFRVDKDGEEVAMLGPGQYFGEIALLRDVPRTASVIAVGDAEVLVLEREPFLVAMSQGRPPARQND